MACRYTWAEFEEFMKYYFDESGDFSIPSTASIHRTAVVAGVAISELGEEALLEEVRAFIRGLPAAENKVGSCTAHRSLQRPWYASVIS